MSKACLVIALICFVLAVFNVAVAGTNMIAAGLAFWVASSLVG